MCSGGFWGRGGIPGNALSETQRGRFSLHNPGNSRLSTSEGVFFQAARLENGLVERWYMERGGECSLALKHF